MSESDESALTFHGNGIFIWKRLMEKKLDFRRRLLLRPLKLIIS